MTKWNGIKTRAKCSFAEETKNDEVIVVSIEIFAKIKSLTDALDTEWCGYLPAHKEDNKIIVDDLIVTEQEVTSATVKSYNGFINNKGLTGTVHSHVNMGVSFSGTDTDFANSNNDFSVVINKKGSINAVRRVDLPCGGIALVDTKVIIDLPDTTDFVKDAKTKIKKIEYKIQDDWWKGTGKYSPTKSY